MGIALLIMLIIIGSKNKSIFKYGVVGCIPLTLRVWNHYLITPYTLFLLAFLKEDDQINEGETNDKKKIK